MNRKILFLLFCLCPSAAFASGPNFNDTNNQALTSGSNPDFSVNVGIGSAAPSGALDVGSGSICLGHVCDSTWPGAGSNYWSLTAATGNVGISTTNTVGIGTTSAGAGAGLVVMNGNVGIGTWAPTAALSVVGNVQVTGQYGASGSTYYFNAGTGLFNITTGYLSYIYGADAAERIVFGAGYDEFLPGINVGIGSSAPGKQLDVQGTIRTTNFTMSGQTPVSGYVLTASDSSGDTTWTSAGSISAGGWTVSGANVYETGSGNVGIGTSAVTTAALTVMNGNVGIGTWVPAAALVVMNGNVGIGTTAPIAAASIYGNGNTDTSFANSDSTGAALTIEDTGTSPFNGGQILFGSPDGIHAGIKGILENGTGPAGALVFQTRNTSGNVLERIRVNFNGNVGINTTIPNNLLSVAGGVAIGSAAYSGISGPTNGLIVAGNVGINSTAPGQMLDVQGTIRTTGFTMSGQTPISGYVLTALDGNGDTTWTSAGSISAGGWTVSGSNVYETGSGNVGIGTSAVTTAALTVMNGNVGIGTWVPRGTLDVEGTLSKTIFAGNVGIGTTYTTGAALAVMNGNVGIGTWAPGAALVVMNGNVGIGTTAANNMLHIQGSVSLANGLGITLKNTNASNTNGWYIGTGGAVVASDAFSIGDNSNYKMTFLSSGNVGIGTITPNAQLSVAGNGVGIGTNTNDAYITTTPPSGGMIVEGNVGIGTWASSGALVVMNGNVGIGTANPQTILQANLVSGDSIFNVSSGTHAISLYANNINDPAIYWDSANVLRFGVSPTGGISGGGSNFTEYMRINSAGNVGIGTTAPAGTLDVEGTVQHFYVASSGNVGIGTTIPGTPLQVVGNVGIGTTAANSTPYTLRINNIAVFNSEYTNGASKTTNFTINWASGNKQSVEIGATGLTATFTNPAAGVGMFQLKVIQDGSGSRTITTWSASSGTIYWAGGSAPTLSTNPNYVDIMSCYYDGTNYFCSATTGFAV